MAIEPTITTGRPRLTLEPYRGPVVSRAEALAQGLKSYFLGMPCRHGHIAKRQTSNKECHFCAVMRSRNRVYSDDEKARRREWRRTSKDEINAYRRATLRAQGAKRNAIVQRWYDSPKGKAWWAAYAETKRAIVRNRRAKQRASEGQHTAADIADILRLQRGRCAYCRKPVGKGLHVDHIIPVAQGGSNDRRNLQITCAACNMSKNRSDPIAYATRIGRLI